VESFDYVGDAGDYNDTGSFFGSIGHALSSAARSVEHAAQKGLHAISANPLWNIVQTGAAFIPGIGTAVSAGMASAAAIGRGASLANIGLSAAKSALGPAGSVGVDVALGAIRGHNLSAAALSDVRKMLPGGDAAKGAFDATVAIEKKLPSSHVEMLRAKLSDASRAAFDKVLAAHASPPQLPPKNAPAMRPQAGRSRLVRVPRVTEPPNRTRPFPHASAGANRVAEAMLNNPGLRGLPAAQLATSIGATSPDAQEAIASFLARFGAAKVEDWRDVGYGESLDSAARRCGVSCPYDLSQWPDETAALSVMRVPAVPVTRTLLHALYKRGDENIRRALLAHNLLAHVARNTGELTGTTWTVRAGDTPYGVAQQLTHNGNRWKEFTSVNPSMVPYTDANGNTQLKGWYAGKSVNVPPSWFPATVPLAAPAPSSSSVTGGPPFPAPSQYPGGYPSSVYVVKDGDNGSKVASMITGDPTRWKELLGPNPRLADPKYGIALYTGNRVTLPASWVAPQAAVPVVVATQPGAVTIQPVPLPPVGLVVSPPPLGGGVVSPMPLQEVPPITVTEPISIAMPRPTTTTAPVQTQPAVMGSEAQLGVLEIQLASFYRAHSEAAYWFGLGGSGAVAGSAPFGSDPTDFAGQWGPRTQAAFAGFQTWWNGQGKTPKLPTDGLPDDQTVAALQAQTKADTPPEVTQAAQTAAAATTPPSSAKKSGDDGALLVPLAALLLSGL